jgi:hypothetical protein
MVLAMVMVVECIFGWFGLCQDYIILKVLFRLPVNNAKSPTYYDNRYQLVRHYF